METSDLVYVVLDMFTGEKSISVADPGFSPGGAPTPKSAIIFQFYPQKLHENERIWTPRGGARPWRPPLDPPMNLKTALWHFVLTVGMVITVH